MHFRRLASLLLGMWLGGSFFMTMVATQNFRTVDRVLATPETAARHYFDNLGPESARMLLRHFASEQNRFYFATWEWLQLALGAALILAMALGSREKKHIVAVAGGMLAIVVLFRFVLTPHIVELGRTLDFQPVDMPSDERSRFWDFHNAYSALEVVKWLMGLGLAAYFTLPKRRSTEVPDEIDAIEKAHHRHINR